jgi:hypothetical protein
MQYNGFTKTGLLTSATVVEEAIRFVSEKSNNRNIKRNEDENRAITNQVFLSFSL